MTLRTAPVVVWVETIPLCRGLVFARKKPNRVVLKKSASPKIKSCNVFFLSDYNHQFTTSLLMKRAFWPMQIISCISCFKHSSLPTAQGVGWCSFPESLVSFGVLVTQLIPSWRGGSGTFSFSFVFTLVHGIVFHYTPFSSRALTCGRPLYAKSYIYFPLPLDMLSTGAPPVAGFSSCRSREEECCSRIFCSRHRSPTFSVWYRISIPFTQEYLECPDTVTASAVLTVEC